MKAKSIFISQAALAAAVLAVFIFSLPAKADIDLSIESVSGTPGSSGTFDVLLTNTGGSSQNIAAFNFELSTTDVNITFNDVTTATTTAPYIFPSSGTGPDIVTPPAGGQTIEAGDYDATFNGTDVAPGATYGIGSVAYSIAGGAGIGEIASISFDLTPTSLSDDNFNNVDFNTASGTITVTTAVTVVPEPSSLLLLGGVLFIASAFLFIRRRSQA
jgi:hypothetical protein